jgi:hypothetical protein
MPEIETEIETEIGTEIGTETKIEDTIDPKAGEGRPSVSGREGNRLQPRFIKPLNLQPSNLNLQPSNLNLQPSNLTAPEIMKENQENMHGRRPVFKRRSLEEGREEKTEAAGPSEVAAETKAAPDSGTNEEIV